MDDARELSSGFGADGDDLPAVALGEERILDDAAPYSVLHRRLCPLLEARLGNPEFAAGGRQRVARGVGYLAALGNRLINCVGKEKEVSDAVRDGAQAGHAVAQALDQAPCADTGLEGIRGLEQGTGVPQLADRCCLQCCPDVTRAAEGDLKSRLAQKLHFAGARLLFPDLVEIGRGAESLDTFVTQRKGGFGGYKVEHLPEFKDAKRMVVHTSSVERWGAANQR